VVCSGKGYHRHEAISGPIRSRELGPSRSVPSSDLDGAIRNPFGARRIDAAQQPHDPETGTEALFGVRPVGEDGDDQPLSARANRLPPALEAFRRPFGVTAMGTGHLFGVGAMAPAAIAPDMSGNALATVEHLDRARGDADVDLLADQGVWHRIEETLDLDVIVQADASQLPLGQVSKLGLRINGSFLGPAPT
jgi:hypothetical protein